MKKLYIYLFTILFGLITNEATSQTIWDGPTITFLKNAGGVDWTLEANQDRLTDSVWITRANNQGIFNIAQEDAYQGNGDDNFGPSPVGTEWAFGSISDGIENLSFMRWIDATVIAGNNGFASPPDLVDSTMVLHLIFDDIYIDIKFVLWGGNLEQGSFAYERSSESPLSVEEVELKSLRIFPNPSNAYIRIEDMDAPTNIDIYTTTGELIKSQKCSIGEMIQIEHLPKGTYILKTAEGRSTTFTKI